ncbi:MAG: single-stranded DNA-binding protein [Oscillospiraceae bacterium]|jgi:single-strand DNA-binding protein|nr:single-stranded DNA-binding protein [Oscillospiraceae bacterium]
MLNHIVLMGRLVRDPELRRTQSGVPVTTFRIAVDRDFGNRETGERDADFIDIVAWRQTGEFVNKYFSKGRMVVVSGRLQMRNWTDNQGNKRTNAEVVADNVYFGDSKRDNDNSGSYNGSSYADGNNRSNGGYAEGNNRSYNDNYASSHGGYAAPAAPAAPAASDFAMLEEDDNELPF